MTEKILADVRREIDETPTLTKGDLRRKVVALMRKGDAEGLTSQEGQSAINYFNSKVDREHEQKIEDLK